MKRHIDIKLKNRFLLVQILFLLVLALPVFSEEINVTQDSTFCFVGDTGHVNEIQKNVADALADSECNAIWHTGDIVYPDGISSKDDPRFIANFLRPFNKVFNKKIPFFLTLGNHDYKKEPKSYLEIAKNNSLIVYPNNYYSNKYGKLCIFSLDTTIFDKLYLFYKRREQKSWLRKIKEDMTSSCELSIAVAHHPLFSSGDRKNATPQLSRFLETDIFGTFDLYIAGHNHVLADEGERRGTRQLISGTGSLPGGSPEEQPEGKFNVETPGFLKLELKEIDNKVVAEYSFIQAQDNLVLWEGLKIGSGIRKNN
jgi:DNA repair exonuclease SbcCD nuclease subunit